MRRVLQLWLISRAAYIAISVVVLVYLPWIYPPYSRSAAVRAAPTIIRMWFRYDANRYMQIATGGYQTQLLGNWPPLYPLLVHALMLGLPVSPPVTALLGANLASLAGCLGLARLQSSGKDLSTNQPSVAALLCYPLAFFLAAPWAMSLLFCLSVWCFYFISRKTWSLAALCVFLAVLDADIGICLAIPLCWSWLQHLAEMNKSSTRLRHFLVEPAVVFFSAPLGLSVWVSYQVMLLRGQVESIVDQTTYFGHHLVWPGLGLWLIVSNVWTVTLYHRADLLRLLVDVVPFLGMLTIAVYASLRRMWPISHGLYVFALLTMIAMLPVSGQQFPDVIVSAGRYLLAAIPIWLVLPRIFANHRRLGLALLVISCALQVVILVYYLRGGWLV